MTNVQNAALSKESKRAKLVRSASEAGSINETSSVVAGGTQSAQNDEVTREEDKVKV